MEESQQKEYDELLELFMWEQEHAFMKRKLLQERPELFPYFRQRNNIRVYNSILLEELKEIFAALFI